MTVIVSTPVFNTDTTVNRSGSDWNNGWTGNRLELGRRSGKGVLEKANFYQWHDMLIPKDSVINSANLRITADIAGRGTAFTATVRGMNRDGLWNSDASGLDYRKAQSVAAPVSYCDNQVELFSGAMVSQLLTIAANMNINDNRVDINRESAWPRLTKCAQTVTPTSTFTLTSVSWAMVRLILSGAPSGSVFLEIQSVDGAGKPTGTVLATSDTRLVSSIPTGIICLRENFLFSGGNQITISSGVKVAVVMNVTYSPTTTDALQSGVRGGLTNQYAGGELWSYGNGRGFDDNNYPNNQIIEDIGTTTASVVASIPFPSPAGTNVDTSVTSIIQEIVNDAGYTNTGRIALSLVPVPATTQDNDIFNVLTTPTVGPILTVDFTAPAAVRRRVRITS